MIRIEKTVEHVPALLQRLNYKPESTFILTDLPLPSDGGYRIEKNALYNRKKLISEIQKGSLVVKNLVLLSSAEKESFMVDFVDDLQIVHPNVVITYIPNVIQPTGKRSMYYRVLHVYAKAVDSTVQSLIVVAINKCFAQASYDSLLRGQPEFIGKNIIGFTEEDVLDYYDVVETDYIKIVI